MTLIFDNFNRQPPPGFRGFNPDMPVRFYSRHLPHWRQDGASYFVTFRLNDALPPEILNELKSLREQFDRECPGQRTEKQWEEYARKVTQVAEVSLDSGYGACHFAGSENAKTLAEALRHYHTTQCEVACLAVMPNHAHAVMKPIEGFQLEETLKLIKGFTAREINKRRDGSGSIWEQESYDRIIRDTRHLENVVRYIGRNHLRAGLPSHEFDRWICPEWKASGWDFD